MAGESRLTHVIAGVNRIGSDSANKVFALTHKVLACTAGWAFMRPQNTAHRRNISALIEDFKTTIPAGSSVQAIAELLRTHFDAIYQQHIVHYPNERLPAGHVGVSFVVAGYDANSLVGTLFPVNIPSTGVPLEGRSSSKNPGPWWIGQTEVCERILKGYDARALGLPFVQAANQNGAAAKALSGLEYAIIFNTMTLQDAIDFAAGLIQVTITIQKFAAGIIVQPGSVAGVGGAIDVAVVQPDKTIQWIARKELHA